MRTVAGNRTYGFWPMAFKRVSILIAAVLLALGWLGSPSVAEPFRIVGFGDSLMAGYGLDPGQSVPEKLEVSLRAKGHDVVIANAGVSGDTSSGGLSRLDWSVPDGTRLVILELGANDMLRGIGPEITEANIDEMIGKLKARGIGVFLAGMRAAPNLGPDYQQAFDGIYPRLAERHDVPLYSFLLAGVAAEASLLLDDGMHPTAAGVDRIVEGILPSVEAALKEGTGSTQ